MHSFFRGSGDSPQKHTLPPSFQQMCPIVYRPEYNTDLVGLQQHHPFDAHKWGKVFEILSGKFPALRHATYKPNEATENELLLAHDMHYVRGLKDARLAAKALELPVEHLTREMAANMDEQVLRPMRFQTGGTILAAQLAAQNKSWAINIGGGFHHASGKRGGSGFCVYADISIALNKLLHEGSIKRAMIVDLDAHQGNGHERDFLGHQNVYIFDMFNKDIFPMDQEAFKTICDRQHVKLVSGTGDGPYLKMLSEGLNAALDEFPNCDLIVYNAGTDLLAGDPLGRLNISYQGVIRRDEFVFRTARERGIPTVMVTSGGYSAQSGALIADSILNLHRKGLIQLPE